MVHLVQSSRYINLSMIIWLETILSAHQLHFGGTFCDRIQAVCTEAGMFALRERRVHVTQEDFEMAVAKVMKKESEKNMSLRKLWK